MAKIIQPYLFSWNCVDAQSDLDRLALVIDNMPDDRIIYELKRRRKNGSDKYPIVAMWNALLAGIVFQHPTIASLLRELNRNGELRELCGFDPTEGAKAVPSAHNMSRFLRNVIALEHVIHEMFDELVETAGQLLPTLGRELAFDGKAVQSYSTGAKNKETGQTSDPDADHGVKTYRGTDKCGKLWKKVKSWFGYQLHLIVDSNFELPVAFEVMKASASEPTRLMPMMEELKEKHP